jgi:predicted XRE-type DNA-binding protein
LNEIKIRRRALNFIEAVTAHILHHQGTSYAEIVAMLGTTAYRMGEVFRGERHPASAMAALKMLMAR